MCESVQPLGPRVACKGEGGGATHWGGCTVKQGRVTTGRAGGGWQAMGGRMENEGRWWWCVFGWLGGLG